MKTWIQTFPGNQKVYPFDLDPASINAKDIFWALSNKCRFTGFVKHPYSVAQHCVEGARLLPPAWKLPFLLHEVSEAYLPDISSPVKPFVFVNTSTQSTAEFTAWSVIEARHADIILPAIGCGSIRPLLDSPEVKKMDLAMLAAEKEQLLGESPEDWGLTEPAADVKLYRWDQDSAFREMCAEFERLTGRKL